MSRTPVPCLWASSTRHRALLCIWARFGGTLRRVGAAGCLPSGKDCKTWLVRSDLRCLCSTPLLQTDIEWDHPLDIGVRFHPVSHLISLGVDFTVSFSMDLIALALQAFPHCVPLKVPLLLRLCTLTLWAGLGESKDRFLPQVAQGLWAHQAVLRTLSDHFLLPPALTQSAVRLCTLASSSPEF